MPKAKDAPETEGTEDPGTTDTIALSSPDESITRDYETDDMGSVNTARALGWATTEEHAAGRDAAAAHEAHLASMYDDIGTDQVQTTATEGTAGSSADETSEDATE